MRRTDATHNAVAVVEAEGQSARVNLWFYYLRLGVSPWHRNDLGVILPGLCSKDCLHKQTHIWSVSSWLHVIKAETLTGDWMRQRTAYRVDSLLSFHRICHSTIRQSSMRWSQSIQEVEGRWHTDRSACNKSVLASSTNFEHIPISVPTPIMPPLNPTIAPSPPEEPPQDQFLFPFII